MNTIPMRLPERQAQVHRRLLIWLPLALLILGPVTALAQTYESESIAGTQASEQVSADGGGTRVIWRRIVGIVVPDNIVGVEPPSGGCDKTCAVGAPAPWITTAGRAEVNLDTGKLTFTVHGLVVAFDYGCCNIGTPGTIVTKVKGTLVCNDTKPGFGEPWIPTLCVYAQRVMRRLAAASNCRRAVSMSPRTWCSSSGSPTSAHSRN